MQCQIRMRPPSYLLALARLKLPFETAKGFGRECRALFREYAPRRFPAVNDACLAAIYRLVTRNTSRGLRCLRRCVYGCGHDSNRFGRSGMRLVGVRHSLSGGENANAATGQNIGHVAVNCVRWANCDRPIAVLIRPDAILANMDDTTIVEVRIATLRKERSGDERS